MQSIEPTIDDYSEVDIFINSDSQPNSNKCNQEKPDYLFLIVRPRIVSFQSGDIKLLIEKFKFILEIYESKFNTNIKPVNILTNKNLHLLLIPLISILPIFMIIYKKKILEFFFSILLDSTSRSCKENLQHSKFN